MGTDKRILFTCALAALSLAACAEEEASQPAADDIDQDGATVADGDCDDLNRLAYPGAPEVAEDGVDQDCDGQDLAAAAADDIDQDGVTVAQGDCDDLDRSVFPGARERALDGTDQDCDGQETPVMGEDRFAEALGLLDSDLDGAISLDEFTAACNSSASLDGAARPGVVQTHSSCSGTGSCRGMHMHPWNEFFVHDCRGVNYCAGWSCVETAADSGWTGEEALAEAGCLSCHSGANEGFKVLVPPGTDVAAFVDTFLDRSDDRFVASIAFGVAGVGPTDVAFNNMPAHYERMSLREIEAVIVHLRTLPLEGETYEFVAGEHGSDGK